MQIDNVSMSYIERPATKDGEPTLVFIHGFTSQKLGWSPVFWYLPKSWRIIAVDLPGHGHSGFSDNFNYSINGIVSMLHKVQYMKYACIHCERSVGHMMRSIAHTEV